MPSWFILMPISHLLASAILFGLAFYGFTRTTVRPLRALSFFCLISGWWALFSAIIFFTPDFETKILLNRVKLLAPALLPMAIVSLAFSLMGRRPWQKWAWLTFCSIPILTVLQIASPWHENFVGMYRIDTLGGYEFLAFSNGPWFKMHIIHAQLAVLLAIVSLLGFRHDLNSHHRYRVWLVVIAISSPFIADAVAVHMLEELRFVQLVPTLLLFSSGLILYAVMRNHLINVVPFARGVILNATEDLYLIFDAESRLVDFNTKAKEVLALNLVDIGSGWAKLVTQNQRLAEIADVRDQSSVEWHFESDIYEVSHGAISDPQGYQLGFMLGFKNVTARRKNELELERLNLVKARILAIIGHDFQGSLAASLVISQSLARSGDRMSSEEMRFAHENLLKIASENISLMEDLLAWSKTILHSSEWKTVELGTLTTRVIDFLRPQAQMKGIRIDAQWNGNFSTKTDSSAFTTVVRNLIANAIKFSPSNARIAVHFSRSDDSIALTVEDHGPGIDLEKQANLFDAHKNGSGRMGLFLCREMMASLGGTISVESKLGQGSRFCITLPMAF